MKERLVLSESMVVRMPRGVRLQHDKSRDMWIIQAPERRFELDQISTEIVRRINGEISVGQVIDALVEAFAADRQVIATDVIALLQDLCDKGVLDQ